MLFCLTCDGQFLERIQIWQMTNVMAVKLEKSTKESSSSIFTCKFRNLISDCLGGCPENSFQSCILDQALKALFTPTRGVYLNRTSYNSLSECLFSPWLVMANSECSQIWQMMNDKCHGCQTWEISIVTFIQYIYL